MLRRDTNVGMVEPPVVVRVRRDVRPFVRISSQIEELRKPQRNERLSPNAQRSRDALLLKNKLPVVVAQADEFGVVIEVEELLSRALLRLAGQERH